MEVNRDLFFEKLRALIATKREDNCFYFSQEKYSKILSEVTSAKTKCSTPLDYRRLKRFDVLKINEEEKLIVPMKPGETNVQYYVTNDELFSILSETHTRIGHGGRTRMLKELQVKYKNITYEVVMLYLNLCKKCQMKHNAPKKGVAKPILASEFNSKCQVNLIDLESHDGEFRFVMVYQDHLTKFVQLRALRTKTAEEVVKHLLHVFATFGAPAELQSDVEFCDQIISELSALWKDVKMVRGKTQTETASQDIRHMLTAWMKDNDTSKWSNGLPFVQFTKNTTYHEGLRQSPYEAMFGVKPNRGIALSSLPGDQIGNVQAEEQLEETVNSLEGNTKSVHIPVENVKKEPQPTTSATDEQRRTPVKGNLVLEAAKMVRTSKRKCPTAQIGDTVRIRVDSGSTDVLAVVVGIEDSECYKLANKKRCTQAALYRTL